MNAIGGNGGSQLYTIPLDEAEGPGGGGGGGVLSFTTANTLTTNFYGGKNGTSNSNAMINFLPNGATKGAAGIIQSGPTNPYSAGSQLPITLLNFSGIEKNNSIEVSWITSSEINNSFFTLDRSDDGKEYSLLTKISGAGNSIIENSYQFIDESPLTGNNYYRLSQFDFDDNMESFPPILIQFNKEGPGFKIIWYHLDLLNEFLTIDFNVLEEGEVEIQCINSIGKIIKSEKTSATKGINAFTLYDTSDLEKGIYFVRIVKAKSVTPVVKVVKIN